MGQKLVHHAENLAALGEDQYGSHLNKSCLDIVARKMLTLNISRLTWHDLITFDNDAISCFDQQIPLFAIMVCQKFGLSSKICKIFAETLSDMRYYIQSWAKRSKKFHHHLKMIWCTEQGIEMGNLLQSGYLQVHFSCVLHQGMKFEIFDGMRSSAHPIDAIVNDTMVVVNWLQSYPHLVQKAQWLAQDWVDLLWMSGGTLELKNAISIWIDRHGNMENQTWNDMIQQQWSRSNKHLNKNLPK